MEGSDVLDKADAKAIYVYREVAEPIELGPSPEELGLDERLSEALRRLGIGRLYAFQAEAYRQILTGKDVMIVAGTGTGKTEAFLIPTIERAIRRDLRPAALLIYPTKALARDQLRRMRVLHEMSGVRASVLDGDTPHEERKEIYADPPHILITNPDMIHHSLAYGEPMRDLIRRAELAVFDEFHVYDGVFGSHLVWLMKRILRLSNLQLVGAGATIGNPEEIGKRVFGREPVVIRGPRRRKGTAYHYFVDGQGKSRWGLAAAIIRAIVSEGAKVIGFTDSQQMAELLARMARKRGVRAAVHRAGLDASYRREVEESFAKGEIDAVVATSTLELGIDIGSVDAVVMPALPPSYAAYLQRAGRAGRRDRPGYIFSILGDNPIEAYYASRPREFFSQEIPPVRVEPANPEVALLHIAATVTSSGFVPKDIFPEGSEEAIEDLVSGRTEAGKAIWRENGTLRGDRKILRKVLRSKGLRSVGPSVMIVEDDKVIGFREMPMALLDLYPGAIYYHAGTPYMVTKLDLEKRFASVRRPRGEIKFYTEPLYDIDIVEVRPLRERTLWGTKIAYAKMLVSMKVKGYVMKWEEGGHRINEVMLPEPIAWSYWTRGIMGRFPGAGLLGPRAIEAFHALEHVLISASQPVCGLADRDLAGVSYPTGHIAIYDPVVGGSGASWLVFQRLERVVEVAEKILSGCSCEDGCPRCVFSPYCGNNNMMLSRRGALEVARALVKGEAAAEAPYSGRSLA